MTMRVLQSIHKMTSPHAMSGTSARPASASLPQRTNRLIIPPPPSVSRSLWCPVPSPFLSSLFPPPPLLHLLRYRCRNQRLIRMCVSQLIRLQIRSPTPLSCCSLASRARSSFHRQTVTAGSMSVRYNSSPRPCSNSAGAIHDVWTEDEREYAHPDVSCAERGSRSQRHNCAIHSPASPDEVALSAGYQPACGSLGAYQKLRFWMPTMSRQPLGRGWQ